MIWIQSSISIYFKYICPLNSKIFYSKHEMISSLHLIIKLGFFS